MEIKRLEKAAFAGKRFAVRYMTSGSFDIRPAEAGFLTDYVPFETAVERGFEDGFFGEWLDEPTACGAFENGVRLDMRMAVLETQSCNEAAIAF